MAELLALVDPARQHLAAAVVAGRNWVLAGGAHDVLWQGRLAAGARGDDRGICRARRAVAAVACEVALAVSAALRFRADNFAAECRAAACNLLGDFAAVAWHLDFDVAWFAGAVMALGFAGVEAAVEELVADVVARLSRVGSATHVGVRGLSTRTGLFGRLEFAGWAGAGMTRNGALVRATISSSFAADFAAGMRREEGIDFWIYDLRAEALVLLRIIVHGVAGGASELRAESSLARKVAVISCSRRC